MNPLNRISRLAAALIFVAATVSVASAQQLIGTYTVNYRYNAAGCNAAGNFGPTQGNPYFCPGPFAPGPIFLSEPPGQYRIVETTVSHMTTVAPTQPIA